MTHTHRSRLAETRIHASRIRPKSSGNVIDRISCFLLMFLTLIFQMHANLDFRHTKDMTHLTRLDPSGCTH